MAEIKSGICKCKDCIEKRANEQNHLDHPFYKRVDEVVEDVKVEQILKGAAKYPEPFNPASWTNKELVWHQLQELRDAQVYSVGLLERLEEQEAEIEKGKYAIVENSTLRKTIEIQKENYEVLLKNYQSLDNLYFEDMEKVKVFTRFIVENFPNAGNAGDFAIDIAMDLLKDYENEKEYSEFWRLRAKKLRIELDEAKGVKKQDEMRGI